MSISFIFASEEISGERETLNVVARDQEGHHLAEGSIIVEGDEVDLYTWPLTEQDQVDQLLGALNQFQASRETTTV